MLWCSIQQMRRRKSSMVMEALCKGWREGARCIEGDPPDDGNPFAIYGQVWGAERLLPHALMTCRPFWYIDNGYWKPGRGSPEGYYRICYRSMMPVYLTVAPCARAKATGVHMAPWRRDGGHILLALPGRDYGRAMGVNIEEWIYRTIATLKHVTRRKIVVRDRNSKTTLADDLNNCWALVTHSSNAAVEAVLAGVPVFVMPGSSAEPVGNVDLADIEQPKMPGNRGQWWASLMCQQFNVAEMANGTAYDHLVAVREKFDGELAEWKRRTFAHA